MHPDSIFFQLGILTVCAATLGIVARVFKQPIIAAYLLTGVLLGVGGTNLIPNSADTQDIAKVGIVFLLFLVGLELNISQIRRLKTVVLVTGFVQLGVVFGIAYAAASVLGYGHLTSVYLGIAASFSSTAVVLKWLSDRHELAALHGRVAVGILLLQDIVAMILLMGIAASSREGLTAMLGLAFLLKGAAFFTGIWLLTKYVLPRLFFYIAKSTELLFLASIAWAFLFAIVAESLGFSKEIGAFTAGLSLATLPYSLEIISRIKPLKDFFLTVFFVVLGLEVAPTVVNGNLMIILVMTGIVLFVKSFVISATMARLGYPKRPAYLTGAVLGQMSEFSLLIVLIGASVGQIPQEMVAVTSAVVVLTVILNTYWNDLNRFIYPLLVKPLKFIGGQVRAKELRYRPNRKGDHILMFGANRTGYHILKTFEKYNEEVVVVDHNPEVIRRLLHRGIPSVYGDIDDYELLQEIGLAEARMVISTVPSTPANLYLIKRTRATNPKALIILTAEQVRDALALYAAGADYVIIPHILGGEQAAQMLEGIEAHLTNAQALRKRREHHIETLKHRHHELVG
jgi:Kef-type K+ transport system membrane component KefB/Trk K+ transport system NAD-binding subunit